ALCGAVEALNPVKKARPVEIGKEYESGRDGKQDEGCAVMLLAHARALDREQICARRAADDRDDQKGAQPHAAQAKDIAEYILGEPGDEEEQESDSDAGVAAGEEVEFIDHVFLDQPFDKRAAENAAELESDPRPEAEPDGR